VGWKIIVQNRKDYKDKSRLITTLYENDGEFFVEERGRGRYSTKLITRDEAEELKEKIKLSKNRIS
jgi:hypothetical protein